MKPEDIAEQVKDDPLLDLIDEITFELQGERLKTDDEDDTTS